MSSPDQDQDQVQVTLPSPAETPVPTIEPKPEEEIQAEVPTQPSESQTVTLEKSSTPTASSGISKAHKEAVERILQYLTHYANENDVEIGAPFARLIGKRTIPEYYDIIKEPVAFSTIRQKFIKKAYTSFKEVTRDFALITYNAQVFNKANSPIALAAIEIGKVAKAELDKLAEQGLIPAEDTIFPYLGEIPIHEEDDAAPEEEEEEEEEEVEEEDDEDEDDEEDEGTDDDRPKRKGRRGRRSSANTAKKADAVGKEDPEAMKRRGRPPKVHTPMEGRINNLLKNIRKFKHSDGSMKILPFERLPDKAETPDYYVEIKNPIAMDLIKKKAKRKKYQSVDHVLADLKLLFDNAKSYNLETSQIYEDAVELQKQALILAAEEKQRPDSDFVDEDGRLPVPEILHDGEIYKVGDWIHLENGNDITKPIVAQIYRTWQDPQGQKWINACWYYRPEQTVHRYEKHFYPNEVVKTGQYRDHKIEEISDRCFVMFFTRYFKGRPRGLNPQKEVYVCEARYNEEKHKLNKIKTWASCVPDEVRDKDYEMDIFEAPRKAKKIPSPIKHLLREDAKENDPLPKPTWGVPNAPPIVGAVHRLPRDENESPPPDPTPPPQPRPIQRPTPTAYDSSGDVRMSGVPQAAPAPSPVVSQTPNQSYSQQYVPRPSPSPAPVLQHHNSYGSQGSGHPSQTPAYQPQQSYNQYSNSPTVVAPNPLANYNNQYQNSPAPRPITQSGSYNSHSAAYNPPKQSEVWALPDGANAYIPEDIRKQFHHDEQGRILFFTTPPVDANPVPEDKQQLGHSLRYLADKARSKDAEEKKRKAVTDKLENEASERVKRMKSDAVGKKQWILDQKIEALVAWSQEMDRGTDELYKQIHGDDWQHMRDHDLKKLVALQEEASKKQKELEEFREQARERKNVKITGFKWV